MADGPASTVDQLLAGLQRSATVERRGRLVEVLGTTLKVTGIAPHVRSR
jgi:ATP synthase in type III secretion protein N